MAVEPVDMAARDGADVVMLPDRDQQLASLMAQAERLGVTVNLTSQPVLEEYEPTTYEADDEDTKRRKDQAHAEAVEAGRAESKLMLDRTSSRPGTETILLHFLEDGFTALGAMWYKGQELEFVIERDGKGNAIGSPAYLATCDRLGKSWVHMVDDEMGQVERYGKILMRRGPWPGKPWPDDVAAQEEIRRARKPPVPANLPPRR